MKQLVRHNVLGVHVSAVDYSSATDVIIAAARERRSFAATALAVHGVMTGYDDLHQRARINGLDLVTPDGQPVRWALNWLYGTRLRDRVYGPFLMLRVCERAEAEGLSVFLFGSDVATLAGLQQALRTRFPALRIAGTQPSRFRRATESEWHADIETLRVAQADIIFCGLGCPRQETWVYEMRSEITQPLVAVGAAFAFWAGRQRMAPEWMQRHGLEWAFRLAHEPRRLAARYLVNNPLYLAHLIRQKLCGHRPRTSCLDRPPTLHFG
jgi:N-acetylglucosaminyldiphosphoundecaprenol N-acetyl-beta-D-mannosaminyltransferase